MRQLPVTTDATATNALVTIAPATEASGERPARNLRLTLVLATCTLLLVAGGTAGGIAWYNHATHEAAVIAATEARVTFGQAENANGGATSQLDRDLRLAVTYNLTLDKILAEAPYFDAVSLEATSEARKPLIKQLQSFGETDNEGKFIPVVLSISLPSISRVIDPSRSTQELTGIQDQFVKLAAAATDDTDAKNAAITALAEAVTSAEASLVDVGADVPSVALNLLAAAPSADQATRDAFAAALATIVTVTEEGRPLSSSLLAYVDAAKALKISHDTAEAAKAAEAQRHAEEEASRDSASNGGSGGGGGGNSGGGGSGGSGGGGSGGGGTGSGGTGGGGGYVPDTNRYLVTNGNYVPYDSCYGGGSVVGGHDPGAGGSSSPGYGFPWSATGGGSSGFTFYAC